MAVLVNSSYRQCIVPDCKELPIFAIIIDGTNMYGKRFRVATILTCSEHTDEGDLRAKTDYPTFAREIFDNPPWLLREQGRMNTNERTSRLAVEALNTLARLLSGSDKERPGGL